MAGKEEKGGDFYGVLGLKKECTEAELRNAYKKLALRWHPDRCSASGNSKYVEEAKKKFQSIQEAYSVLSDVNKRFLYDVGVYDCDDDENGMTDFLNEMAVMMSQNETNENREESFEELKELFEEMFQSDMESFGSSSQTGISSSSSSSLFASCSESFNSPNKRSSSQMEKTEVEASSGFDAHFQEFCLGTGGMPKNFQEREKSRRVSLRKGSRSGQKPKVPSGYDGFLIPPVTIQKCMLEIEIR